MGFVFIQPGNPTLDDILGAASNFLLQMPGTETSDGAATMRMHQQPPATLPIARTLRFHLRGQSPWMVPLLHGNDEDSQQVI